MASSNTPPSFPSAVIQTIEPHPEVGTTVDMQAFGGPKGNPMAADIHGQPLSYGDFGHGQHNSFNQFQGGSVSRGQDNTGWYSGDQPPSVGAIRPGAISQPGGNQFYADALPPSFTDFDRRETSQTGASVGREIPQEYEFAGMSLTGKNFSRLHPDAFSKGKYGK